MFNLTLIYPKKIRGEYIRESVMSSYLPPVGMELSGSDKVYGTFKVVSLGGNIGGGMLDTMVYVELAETD